MKIGFDISQIAHAGGVGIYTDELTKRLSKDKNLDLVFFYSSLRKKYNGYLPNVKQFFIPPTILELMFNKLRLPSIEQFIGSVDIFHSSDWTQPKSKAKKVTTYHDLVPLKFPKWSHPKIIAVHKRRLKIVEKEIDGVITVSNSTKEDLLKISKIPEEKITVIYEGVGSEFKKYPEEEIERFRKKYNLPAKFILAIGGIGQRRNLDRVKQATKDYALVISGETLPLLKRAELPLLYNAARILLYPSLYEGFGLPILEAMASQTPVITSDRSSMKEISGDGAILVNPEDVNEIQKKVANVMEDKDLRKDLISKGLKNATKFSWENATRETIDFYTKVLSQ